MPHHTMHSQRAPVQTQPIARLGGHLSGVHARCSPVEGGHHGSGSGIIDGSGVGHTAPPLLCCWPLKDRRWRAGVLQAAARCWWLLL